MEYPCRNNKLRLQGSYGAIEQGKYRMMKDQPLNQNLDPRLESVVRVPAKPNESGRLEVQDFVRIYDPNTRETLLEKRA